MAKSNLNLGSVRPLNWRTPSISKGPSARVTSHAERLDRYSRQGTPPTRRGAFHGQVSALRPNPYHSDPQLILKADFDENHDESDGFQESENVDDQGQDGQQVGTFTLYEQHQFHAPDGTVTDVAPGQYPVIFRQAVVEGGDPSVAPAERKWKEIHFNGNKMQMTQFGPTPMGGGVHVVEFVDESDFRGIGEFGRHADHMDAPASKAQEDDPTKSKPSSTKVGGKEKEQEEGESCVVRVGPRGGQFEECPSGSRRYLGEGGKTAGEGGERYLKAVESFNDGVKMLKALGIPQVPLQQKQPEVGGMGSLLAQPKIPGFSQMAPPPQSMQQMPGQQAPVGVTPDGKQVMNDPFHPSHQQFNAADHDAAAQQQAAQGHGMEAQAHKLMGQDAKSPIERAAEKFGPGMPQNEPAGGRTMMPGQQSAPNPNTSGMPQPSAPPKGPMSPGTQQPYGVSPGQDNSPDQGKPDIGQPGTEREGPKPGMIMKPPGPPQPDVSGPSHGEVTQLVDALQQWLEQQQSPGTMDTAPTPGSATMQQPKGAPSDPSIQDKAPQADDSKGENNGEFPEKQTGQKAPLTNAGTQKTPIQETAEKSIFSKLGW